MKARRMFAAAAALAAGVLYVPGTLTAQAPPAGDVDPRIVKLVSSVSEERLKQLRADVDTLMSLRQAMARLGMSVSMAWDAKQATDLLTVVRPEVVVLDLDLPRQAGYGIVARLATANPIPCAVIVPGKDDATDGFSAALAQPGMSDPAMPRDRLLADAIGRQETASRLQKIRAVGRK